MRVQLVITGKEANKIKEKIVKLSSKIESEHWDDGQLSMV